MINEEALSNLYESVLNNKELTTKELNSYGFNSKDLDNMIEFGILKRINSECYEFLSVDKLYLYGKKMIENKEFDKSLKCFEKCYEIDSQHENTNLQLFLRSIIDGKYKKSFRYLEVLINTDNPSRKANINLCLFLLSIFTEIPDEYKDYVKSLGMDDVKIFSKNYNNRYIQNKIRVLILNRRFSHALQFLNEYLSKCVVVNTQNIIIRKLLFHAAQAEKLSQNNIFNLVKSKQYEELIEYLESKGKRQSLRMLDKITLDISQKIWNIKTNEIFPVIGFIETDDLLEAIEGNNYKLALQINSNYNKKYGIHHKENIISLLLSELCDLVYPSSTLIQEKDINEQEKEYVDSQIERLLNEKGIILLDPMESKKVKRIIKMLDKYSNIEAFSIDCDNDKQIVLRYKKYQYININKLSKLGKKFYENKEYNKCISYFLKILQCKKVNTYVYAYLGLSYLKINDKKQAINYMSVATHLSKKYDFTKIIKELKEEEDMKGVAKTNIEELVSDFTNYFGIYNFEEIVLCISQSNLDFESTCLQLGMNEEKTDIIKLLYARSFYFQGDYEKGDWFIKLYEKSKNKTDYTKAIYNNIKLNKKHYVNRNVDGPILKLQYNKKK